MVQVGYAIGQRLCDALGLDANTVGAVDIKIRPNEAVTVTVTVQQYVEKDSQWIEILKEYTLTDK